MSNMQNNIAIANKVSTVAFPSAICFAVGAIATMGEEEGVTPIMVAAAAATVAGGLVAVYSNKFESAFAGAIGGSFGVGMIMGPHAYAGSDGSNLVNSMFPAIWLGTAVVSGLAVEMNTRYQGQTELQLMEARASRQAAEIGVAQPEAGLGSRQ